jgi:multidrug efflux pump subunit AcrA (membrane-fusion protein)
MRTKKISFIFAALGILSAGWVVKKSMSPPVESKPIIQPAKKPEANSIAAAGIIESIGENILVGSPCDGIVQSVFVQVWDPVKKGDVLFQMDSRELEADLKINEANERVVYEQYKKVHNQLARLQSIRDKRSISQDELRSKENEESLALAACHLAKMEKEKTQTLLDRLTVRSPINGVVIQKNIKVGEFLVTTNIESPPIVVGDMSSYQIRVDIDEQNASRIADTATGVAYPKNRPDFAIPLDFVRVEPYVIPKRSLSGSSKEKVDTRVLQVIYTFSPPPNATLYIGQQVDVFIERQKTDELIAGRE